MLFILYLRIFKKRFISSFIFVWCHKNIVYAAQHAVLLILSFIHLCVYSITKLKNCWRTWRKNWKSVLAWIFIILYFTIHSVIKAISSFVISMCLIKWSLHECLNGLVAFPKQSKLWKNKWSFCIVFDLPVILKCLQ